MCDRDTLAWYYKELRRRTDKRQWIGHIFKEGYVPLRAEWQPYLILLKNEIIVKILEKGTRLECGNWRGISVLRASAMLLTKIIPEHLEGLIDREQTGFRTGSSYSDHINTLRIIVE